jgi:S1-C subfamily serine protease
MSEPQSPQTYSGNRSTGSLPALWFMVIVLLIGEVLLWLFTFHGNPGVVADAAPRTVVPRASLDNLEKTSTEIFKENAPCVVHITTLAGASASPFQLKAGEIVEGTGSGFVWDRQGHIVTNAHVIQGADVAQVVLADQSAWRAKLVGKYLGGDLAVLSIDAPPERLHPINVGSSRNLEVGQSVFAIGNPFGLDQTLTTGIVSALNREITSESGRPIKNVIQIDAAINPGNSGGPLLDSAGRLIGVNSAIVSPSGSFAGIGFAIPVDQVNRIVTQLIRHGHVTQPSIGVEVAPEQLGRQLGLSGVLVLGVVPGSPAEAAGLHPTTRDASGNVVLGDIIVAIDDHPAKSLDDLYAALDNYNAGDAVTLAVIRGGESVRVQVKLGAAQ